MPIDPEQKLDVQFYVRVSTENVRTLHACNMAWLSITLAG